MQFSQIWYAFSREFYLSGNLFSLFFQIFKLFSLMIRKLFYIHDKILERLLYF